MGPHFRILSRLPKRLSSGCFMTYWTQLDETSRCDTLKCHKQINNSLNSCEANMSSASQKTPRNFMAPKGSLPHSQQPTTCPCPEAYRSSPCPHPSSLKIHFNIILPSTPRSSKWSPFLTFPYQNLAPIRATCPAHFSLLDFITRLIFGEEYRA